MEGKKAVREALAGRFRGLPDVHYDDATHFVDANTGISKWTFTGTTPRAAGSRSEAATSIPSGTSWLCARILIGRSLRR